MAAAARVPFLPLYAWTGLWTSALLAACSLRSVSNAVKYLSRFTDEVFANLISFIFIYEACKGLFKTIGNRSVPAEQALLSVILTFGTLFVATSLFSLRRGALFGKRVRDLLADFAPTFGLLAGTLAAAAARSRYGISLPSLAVPKALTTTLGRPWLVDLWALPLWARFAAALPAAMVTVLLFFDQNITTRIVNSKGNRLKNGKGDHLDMLVLSFLILAQSLVGMPWLCAATVRSINHVKSLHVYGRKAASAKGEEAGALAVVGTVENRASGFLIHAAIGAVVVWLRPLLRAVPAPALSGLFLYLGQSALRGNQMWERGVGLLSDPALTPANKPWAQVPRATTAAFTAVQFACLAALICIKDTDWGVLFPVVVAALAPVRFALPSLGRALGTGDLFAEKFLSELDRDDE
mmetsp:Transcript_76116/g.152934  ORF Transcript_76116/g.152934 Transcript_76116/m.152934 type:complete len:409 (+) Transcript_76116:1-1227(+)